MGRQKSLVIIRLINSVFTLRLVNLQNLKIKYSFCSSNFFISRKIFQTKYISVNSENLDVDFVPPRFNLCTFENEADEETDS